MLVPRAGCTSVSSLKRVVELDHGGQRFDVDVHHRGGVDRGVPVDRDDGDDRLADEPHRALGDQRPLAAGLEDRLHVRKRRQVDIVAGEDAEHAWHLLGVVDVVRQDPAVRVLAAHEVHPRRVDRHVLDIRAAGGQHPRILDPLHTIAENAPHGYRPPSHRAGHIGGT